MHLSQRDLDLDAFVGSGDYYHLDSQGAPVTTAIPGVTVSVTATLRAFPTHTATPTPSPTPTQAPTPPPAPTASPTATLIPVPTPASAGFEIFFIDVGQGDATLIVASTGETLLVDGGKSKSRIRDRLQALGISDLDAIAVTHPDADHITGLVEVLDLYPIERIYLNGSESDSQTFANFMAGVDAEGAQVVTVTRGNTIALGDLTLEVLHPGPLSGDSNEDSMMLMLDCGEVEVLLTGDAEVESEESMITADVLQDIDVLKVGHHGSRTATSEGFLDVVKPEVGVISAGLNSQYGHPHQEVLDRLAAVGVGVVLTDTTTENDTVRLASDCQNYSLGLAGAPP